MKKNYEAVSNIAKISPMIQSNPDNHGKGIIGFTIQYENWNIENRIYPYTAQTYNALRKQCLHEHSQLLQIFGKERKQTHTKRHKSPENTLKRSIK